MKGLKPGFVPLERALSKLGIASRTQACQMILAGRVRVNGVRKNNPGFAVNPERAEIEIDGQLISKSKPRTYLLYKPKGVVTTNSDEKGRPTVFSLLKAKDISKGAHLIAVGRLDWATSGVLILTNQTRLAAWLTDPENGVNRTYLVTVRGEVTEAALGKIRSGILDKGEELKTNQVTLRKASGKESHLTVELSEGKNREIRRIFKSLGHEVTRLKRVAYGPLELGDLEPGEYRELTPEGLAKAFPGAPL